MSLSVTTVCTVFFALIAIPLSLQVTLRRIAIGNVAVGDGGDAILKLRRETMRNFAEYVPLGLVLLAVYEHTFGSVTSTMVFACLFVFSRLLHVFGFQFMQTPKFFAPAMVMQHTFFSVASVMIIYNLITSGSGG